MSTRADGPLTAREEQQLVEGLLTGNEDSVRALYARFARPASERPDVHVIRANPRISGANAFHYERTRRQVVEQDGSVGCRLDDPARQR